MARTRTLALPARKKEPLLLDLSLVLDERLAVWPGDPLFAMRAAADHDLDGYRVTALSFGTHTGTHLDAPFHAFADGEKLNELPLDYFYGPAAVLDLTSGSRVVVPGTPPILARSFWEPYEEILANVPRILVKTGWSRRVGTAGYFREFPSIPAETIEYLAGFPLLLLGLETPSLFAELTDDPSLDHAGIDPANHRTLLGRIPPIVILESLGSLDELPVFHAEPGETVSWTPDDSRLFTLSCFPLALAGIDACPVRAVAIVS